MKKIIGKIYEIYLKRRWNIKNNSIWLLKSTFIGDYKKLKMSKIKIWQIHRLGFDVQFWCLAGLNKNNYNKYLSTVEYYKMHPINGDFSKWIDDKLTLKYLCTGTDLDRYMPEYYYQVDSKGNILKLVDCPYKNNDTTEKDIAGLLREKEFLAIKLISGSIGEGFYKAYYKDNYYYVNDTKMNFSEFCEFIKTLRNYLITEYFLPHKEISQYYSKTVNCIRYLAGRINGKMEMLKGYIRLGTVNSGSVENYNAGGVLCFLNESGEFTYGNVMDATGLKNQIVYEHPDNGKKLSGQIPLWKEIEDAVEKFSEHFPQMKYLGFDFVITSKNQIKVIEINSLTSIDGFQLDKSVWDTKAASFYRELLK